jgi:acetyl-CoA C-acetyltransferase
MNPVQMTQHKGTPVIVKNDEFFRAGFTKEGLAAIRSTFNKEAIVTAANASGINDTATADTFMSASKAKELGLTPLAAISACSSAGGDPVIMGTGPIPASITCLEKAGWSRKDLDLIEANEAFAAQAISVNKGVGWDTSKVTSTVGEFLLDIRSEHQAAAYW